ncbi:unnamed protein product, partial [Meganyctiphanes norvegica]
TALMTDIYKGSINQRLHHNIPASCGGSPLPAKLYSDATLHSQHSDSQYSQMSFNGLHPENGPVLMFPPPPTTGYDDTSRTSTLASNGSLRHGTLASNGSARHARLLLHQLPYGGSYSLGSQLSQGSPILDSQPPRYTPRMPPSPIMRYGNTASPFSTYRRHYSPWSNNEHLMGDDDNNNESDQNEEEVQWYSQPLINRPTSPKSPRKYEVEETENVCNSLKMSSSLTERNTANHDSQLPDVAEQSSELTRIVSEDNQFTQESPIPAPQGRPPRPPPKYKKYMQQTEIESEVSVTSPLI